MTDGTVPTTDISKQSWSPLEIQTRINDRVLCCCWETCLFVNNQPTPIRTQNMSVFPVMRLFLLFCALTMSTATAFAKRPHSQGSSTRKASDYSKVQAFKKMAGSGPLGGTPLRAPGPDTPGGHPNDILASMRNSGVTLPDSIGKRRISYQYQ